MNFFLIFSSAVMAPMNTILLSINVDDIPLIYFILPIVGMLFCGFSTKIESTLWCFLVSLAGAAMISLTVVFGYGKDAWGAIALGGLFMWGCSFYEVVIGKKKQ